MNIGQFLDQLEGLEQTATLDQLKDLLTQLELMPEDIQEHLHFADSKYQRNYLRSNENFEALLLCFEAGQRTPIHDHAGCACGVKVIQGVGMETAYERTDDGWLYATGTQQLPALGVVGSNDMDIHQLSNLQPKGERLVTLHVYSPPLGEVGNYCVEDNSMTQVTAPTRQTTAS